MGTLEKARSVRHTLNRSMDLMTSFQDILARTNSLAKLEGANMEERREKRESFFRPRPRPEKGGGVAHRLWSDWMRRPFRRVNTSSCRPFT